MFPYAVAEEIENYKEQFKITVPYKTDFTDVWYCNL